MIETTYSDLAEFGLPLITPDEPAFNARFEEIRGLPSPVGPNDDTAPDRAAILDNQTDAAVITLKYVWRYEDASG